MSAQSAVPCIWCGAKSYLASREHVVPEGLGCPPQLVLTEGVCKPCNNRLGLIDQALLAQFEVATVVLGMPRKKGRSPTIDTLPAMAGRVGANGPELFFNGGPGDMQALGRTLKPARPSKGILEHSLSIDGAMAEVQFSQPFGQDRRFRRALYKLALGLVAYYRGAEIAAGSAFDHVRQFVVDDRGEMVFLLALPDAGDIKIDHQFSVPYGGSQGEGPGFGIRLFAIDMFVDLTPGQPMLRKMISVAEVEPDVGRWMAVPPFL